jgi:hypothetical protein
MRIFFRKSIVYWAWKMINCVELKERERERVRDLKRRTEVSIFINSKLFILNENVSFSCLLSKNNDIHILNFFDSYHRSLLIFSKNLLWKDKKQKTFRLSFLFMFMLLFQPVTKSCNFRTFFFASLNFFPWPSTTF